jgi:hypothetical protein
MRDIHSVFSFIQTVQCERVFKVKGGYVVQNFRARMTAVGRAVGRERPDLAVVVVP